MPPGSIRTSTIGRFYDGVDVTFNARLAGGTTLFGAGRPSATCRRSARATTTRTGHRSPIFIPARPSPMADGFCDQRAFDVPFHASVQARRRVHDSVDRRRCRRDSQQSYAGLARTITYQPPATLFPGGRTNTETIILLNEPGSLYYPRYNQVDLNLKKNFRYGLKTFQRADRLLQSSERERHLRAPGRCGQLARRCDDDPPQGRLIRLAFQMKF